MVLRGARLRAAPARQLLLITDASVPLARPQRMPVCAGPATASMRLCSARLGPGALARSPLPAPGRGEAGHPRVPAMACRHPSARHPHVPALASWHPGVLWDMDVCVCLSELWETQACGCRPCLVGGSPHSPAPAPSWLSSRQLWVRELHVFVGPACAGSAYAHLCKGSPRCPGQPRHLGMEPGSPGWCGACCIPGQPPSWVHVWARVCRAEPRAGAVVSKYVGTSSSPPKVNICARLILT